MKFISFACLALSLAACASENVATDDVSTQDDALATAASCGANYGKAQLKYELAVQAAKAINADRVCETVSHPTRSSLMTEATHESVESLLSEAVATCSYFGGVYKSSPWAKPARDALRSSLVSRVLDGSVNGKTFAGLQNQLAGVRMYGPKPGIMHIFTVEFAANGKLNFVSYDWDNGQNIRSAGTYVVRPGARPQIDIKQGRSTTTYNIVNTGAGLIDFVPVRGGDTISTNSDPCSA